MKKNDSESTVEVKESTTTNDNRRHQGFRIGIYGWRKKCLYALILVLLFMVIVNLALTLWVLKVMDFSTSGMGQLEIVPGGLRLKGNAFVLENLIASQIRSRTGEPIIVESSRNITLRSRDRTGRVSSWIHLGLNNLECLSNQFQILDEQGHTLFSVDRNEVRVAAEVLQVTGEGGTRFSGSVQTRLIRAESGHDLRLEAPTRGLQVRAAKELKFESRGGNVKVDAQGDISFRSDAAAIRLHSTSIVVPHIPTAKVTHRPISHPHPNTRNIEVFQLCVCESGRLFLADPHVVCSSESTDGFCR